MTRIGLRLRLVLAYSGCFTLILTGLGAFSYRTLAGTAARRRGRAAR